MTHIPEEVAEELFSDYYRDNPACDGYPSCDGMLPGEPHEPTCPLHGQFGPPEKRPIAPFIAKLIKVAAEATAAHCYECNATETFDECAEEPSCMADICQRIREGMKK